MQLKCRSVGAERRKHAPTAGKADPQDAKDKPQYAHHLHAVAGEGQRSVAPGVLVSPDPARSIEKGANGTTNRIRNERSKETLKKYHDGEIGVEGRVAHSRQTTP